ncbi:MAG: glycosyltransferase family 4 protein [Betaproteobacteria bacterium]|nr:MAG: glycosyltransferase family 4 protein [Betaproteobacteria bacterium]
MRILHTESSVGWGGQEIRILTEAAGMRRRGHDVRLAAPRKAPIFDEAERFSVPVIALPIGRKTLAGLVALRRVLASERVDVVNSHSSTDSWLAALACRAFWLGKRRPPALVRTRHISARIPTGAATRWLYARATAEIVTTGEAIRQQLIRAAGVSPARVTSIPTGIDLKHFAPGDKSAARRALNLPEEAPLIGIVATLRSWKGHRFLVEAMTLLAHRDARLAVVGDGPQKDALAAQVRELGLRERVRLVGNQQDVAPWLRAFDVFALPSYANEGVPQALLQAMAVGVPCVTTAVGAIGEIAIHDATALVVARQNAVALAAGIDRLLGDAALASRLAWSARERTQTRFGIDAMLDGMDAVFRRAARGNRYR